MAADLNLLKARLKSEHTSTAFDSAWNRQAKIGGTVMEIFSETLHALLKSPERAGFIASSTARAIESCFIISQDKRQSFEGGSTTHRGIMQSDQDRLVAAVRAVGAKSVHWVNDVLVYWAEKPLVDRTAVYLALGMMIAGSGTELVAHGAEIVSTLQRCVSTAAVNNSERKSQFLPLCLRFMDQVLTDAPECISLLSSETEDAIVDLYRHNDLSTAHLEALAGLVNTILASEANSRFRHKILEKNVWQSLLRRANSVNSVKCASGVIAVPAPMLISPPPTSSKLQSSAATYRVQAPPLGQEASRAACNICKTMIHLAFDHRDNDQTRQCQLEDLLLFASKTGGSVSSLAYSRSHARHDDNDNARDHVIAEIGEMLPRIISWAGEPNVFLQTKALRLLATMAYNSDVGKALVHQSGGVNVAMTILSNPEFAAVLAEETSDSISGQAWRVLEAWGAAADVLSNVYFNSPALQQQLAKGNVRRIATTLMHVINLPLGSIGTWRTAHKLMLGLLACIWNTSVDTESGAKILALVNASCDKLDPSVEKWPQLLNTLTMIAYNASSVDHTDEFVTCITHLSTRLVALKALARRESSHDPVTSTTLFGGVYQSSSRSIDIILAVVHLTVDHWKVSMQFFAIVIRIVLLDDVDGEDAKFDSDDALAAMEILSAGKLQPRVIHDYLEAVQSRGGTLYSSSPDLCLRVINEKIDSPSNVVGELGWLSVKPQLEPLLQPEAIARLQLVFNIDQDMFEHSGWQEWYMKLAHGLLDQFDIHQLPLTENFDQWISVMLPPTQNSSESDDEDEDDDDKGNTPTRAVRVFRARGGLTAHDLEARVREELPDLRSVYFHGTSGLNAEGIVRGGADPNRCGLRHDFGMTPTYYLGCVLDDARKRALAYAGEVAVLLYHLPPRAEWPNPRKGIYFDWTAADDRQKWGKVVQAARALERSRDTDSAPWIYGAQAVKRGAQWIPRVDDAGTVFMQLGLRGKSCDWIDSKLAAVVFFQHEA